MWMLDAELVKTLLTSAGPMGLLAYGMFLHHSKITQANAEARAADAKIHAERLVDILGDRKADRDLMISVVERNAAAVTALTAKIDAEGAWVHRRATDDTGHSH